MAAFISDDRESLSHCLNRLLSSLDNADGITLNDVFSQVGDKGFGVLLVVLAIPSALPVPAAGYSTPFGILIAILSLQMIFGRSTLWLPSRAKKIKLKRELFRKIVHSANLFFSRFEHLIKPRLRWIGSGLGLPILGLLVLIMACLMILPIPLTNTAPAMVIFVVGVGLSEDDGVFAGVACVLGLLAVLLYAYIIYLALTRGVEGMEKVLEKIF